MAPKALILVDFEKEWVTKGSDYFVGDLSQLVERTNKLLDFCRKKGYKILFTTHVEKDSKDAFAPNSDRVSLLDGLDKKKSDILIVKNKVSPFFKTNLEKELSGINSIVVAGILTNLCVRSLVQDAYDRDFEITLIKDCCTTFDKKTHEFTFADLKATREEINFLDLKEFIQ